MLPRFYLNYAIITNFDLHTFILFFYFQSIVDAKETSDSEMGINIPGLISIIIFYLVVLLIGIWAGWRQRKSSETTDQETVMLAGRNIGLFVGVLTMGGNFGACQETKRKTFEK